MAGSSGLLWPASAPTAPLRLWARLPSRLSTSDRALAGRCSLRSKPGPPLAGWRRLALGADEDVAGFYISCGWEPMVQATISGPDRRTVLERLRLQELAGHEIGTQEQGDLIRIGVPVEGYDAALADRLSSVPGCSAFVMFMKTLRRPSGRQVPEPAPLRDDDPTHGLGGAGRRRHHGGGSTEPKG